MYEAILYIAVAYISYYVSLIMVTITTSHVFTDIFQTEHFSAVKFAMGYEKNMFFLLILKSPKVEKKSHWAPIMLTDTIKHSLSTFSDVFAKYTS